MGLYFNAVDWLARIGVGRLDGLDLELVLGREGREEGGGARVRVAGSGLDMAVPKGWKEDGVSGDGDMVIFDVGRIGRGIAGMKWV